MNIAPLKQYIEKELQTKKFLEDGLEVLNGIEKLQETHRASLKQVESDKKEVEASGAELKNVKQKLKAANDEIDKAHDEAKKIIEKANLDAVSITNKANRDAKKLIDDANEDLKRLGESIRNKGIQKQQLINEISLLRNTKNDLDEGIDKIKKKLG